MNYRGAVAVSGLVLLTAAAALLAYALWSPPKPAASALRRGGGGTGSADSAEGAAASGAGEGKEGRPPAEEQRSGQVISKAALVEIFNEITSEMSRVIVQIGQMEQALLQQAAEANKQIDPEGLRDHLLQEFTLEVREAEASVYARHGVTQTDVEAAAKYFHDDADFQAAVKTLKRKFALFTGQGSDDVPEHITMELIMEMLSETMMKMTAAMEEVFHQTKEKSAVGTEAFNAQLQSAYVERVGSIRQKVQKKYGVDQVRGGLLSSSSAPRCSRALPPTKRRGAGGVKRPREPPPASSSPRGATRTPLPQWSCPPHPLADRL